MKKEMVKEVMKIINKKFREHKKKKGEKEGDQRIHLCLYFLSGKEDLKEDIITMKRLSKYSNILPIIGHGDSRTKEEIVELKKNVRMEAYE